MGSFSFNKRTIVVCSSKQPEVLKLARLFTNQFNQVTALNLSIHELTASDTLNSVIFQLSTSIDSPEGYRLIISPKNIHIEAGTPNGFFYGIQSLYQLLPSEIYGKKHVVDQKWTVPAVLINDAPRFSYRGMHLDVCRHFFPVVFIKKYLDAMAMHKLNTFHWHLTDDQGWRIEIKKYPLLTTVGSRRDETLTGCYNEFYPQRYDGKPYGGFYTQEEAREIVAYAAARFITVIPEIELPGHATAAIASYPYLSCTPDSTVKVATKWGIFKDIYSPGDSTFKFLEDVLTEVMDIFPSKYIHIGGDECLKGRWKTSSESQALIKTLNLKDENGLQSYFVERVEKFVNSKGRQIIGWDEILDGGLAPNATVMSWRGNSGGILAAKSGHDVIMTPGDYCYFDRYQADPANEPTTIGGYLPLHQVYQFEPIPSELNTSEAAHILGAQANVWTEYMADSRRVEYMAFPRVSALSEVDWTSRESMNWESFCQRMPIEFKRYAQLDIHPCRAFFDVQFQTKVTLPSMLTVTLICDDPEAKIHYNLNGTKPTANDPLYTAPITLNQPGTITAATFFEGKMLGKSLSKSFMVSKLTGLTYTQNLNNTMYDGRNMNALTDGILGNTKVYYQWVGIGGSLDGEIVVDMLRPQNISRFSVGLLNTLALGVVYPSAINLYGSLNGINYQLLGERQIQASSSPIWEMIRPELTFPITEVRYLKLQLKSVGRVPFENTKGSNDSMIFLDEIGAW